jgi:hypothetical protein
MYPGSDRIQAAANLLRCDGDERADAVLAGANELWSAMFDMPAWPPAIQTRAIQLQVSLFRYGKINDTVERMSESERRQLRDEMLAFCEYATRLSE